MIKRLIILILLLSAMAFAQPSGPPDVITEEDGSPTCYLPWQKKYTNGTVTCNADGTASIDFSTGAYALDNDCSTNDRILSRSLGVWGCKDYSDWDTAYTHSINNYQAHSDYLLNTGDTATGDYNFDNDTLFVDSTNHRVGIKTNTPATPLDIVGSPGETVMTLTGSSDSIGGNISGLNLVMSTSDDTGNGTAMRGANVAKNTLNIVTGDGFERNFSAFQTSTNYLGYKNTGNASWGQITNAMGFSTYFGTTGLAPDTYDLTGAWVGGLSFFSANKYNSTRQFNLGDYFHFKSWLYGYSSTGGGGLDIQNMKHLWILDSPSGTALSADNVYGLYIEKLTLGSTLNAGVYFEGNGDVGAGISFDGKMEMYSDGTDLIIDPNVVGSGKVLIGATGNDTINAGAYEVAGVAGITDNTSYWLCTDATCTTTCQVTIKSGLITGCP